VLAAYALLGARVALLAARVAIRARPSLLSREHLGALLAAKTLREAEDAGGRQRPSSSSGRTTGSATSAVEEEVLLPTWALHAEVDREGVARMLEEHLEIRRRALHLASGEASLAEARELGQLLHDHVRFEERQLFPLVEEALDASGLSRLAVAIEEAEAAG
jgi:hypothetical protein